MEFFANTTNNLKPLTISGNVLNKFHVSLVPEYVSQICSSEEIFNQIDY